ncbi:MAG: NADH-quinone oxidoreductase subunit L [Fimbriimonadales bacterium]
MSFDLIWAVLLLPLGGFLFQALLGQRIENALGKATGRRVLGVMAVLPLAAGFVITVLLASKLSGFEHDARTHISTWFNWIDLQTITIPFELRVDPLSLTMALIVTGVGALIHVYATGYMAEDKDFPRFFTYLNLFIAFMLMLVLGNNLALVFIGWEGVGLCSYLLIGFWYHEVANAKAANKAFIVNRIGDWGFALGIFLIFVCFASNQNLLGGETRYLSFDVILPLAKVVLVNYGWAITMLIPLLLFIGAMGKSAQFPLYVWLPDAMAGPTPVSALIHAATMVTAGVYLVTRCHVFFELSPIAMLVVAFIGALTAMFAATIAFGQSDIKKVLAYSTVSQLGYMFLACGVGAFSTGMFHVTTHAFFKALLFLGSGAVIHAMAHNQDLRNYGNLKKYLPITYITMLFGWLAICGIPPFAGFFSKDDILGKAFTSAHYWNEAGWFIDPRVFYGVGLITAIMTAMYMTRMFWLTFYGGEERWRTAVVADHSADAHADHGSHGHEHEAHGEDVHNFFYTDDELAARHEEHEHHHELDASHEPHEVAPSMWVPLAVLAALSVVGGAILSGLFPFSSLLGINIPNLFEGWNSPSAEPNFLPSHEMYHASHTTEWVLIAASVGVAIAGIMLMVNRYEKGLPEGEREITGIQKIAGNQWGYDNVLYQLFVTLGGRFANGFYRWFDSTIIDGLFVNGSAFVVGAVGRVMRRTQTGYVRTYAFAMLFGSVLLVSYIIYRSNLP